MVKPSLPKLVKKTSMAENNNPLAEAYNLALVHEKAGRKFEAGTLYTRCLELDPADVCGASVRLAALGLARPPAKAPDAYVATLFDQHADDFDDILTGSLEYAVPMQVAENFGNHSPGPYARMLDLGCGTGLSGMMLQHMCEHATGVDISENMVDKADERASYDELYVNEAVHFLQEWAKREQPDQRPFDLLVATDVLPYIGDLEPLFAGLAANATDRAKLVFSSETMSNEAMGGDNWRVTPNQRFAHSADYLRHMCTNAGFGSIVHFEQITVRLEQGTPIPGYLVIADRT